MTEFKNIDDRINIDAFKEVMDDHEYRNYIKKIRETENEIIRIIGNGKLLGECEELISLVNMIHLENVYKIGFQNGINESKGG